ncbi:3-isopropylmalate dehydratase small subunit [Sphingopyxis sp. SE2]|uniref:3-isopropylmalate dehydratase small subunit n=1 Tax=Sphingopyxis sp. SE2 TaxID=1586240 RepID=UPI0028C23B6A|nr:3-isopropylmalate dehydratase small subunit [Sphingopyxis sp. SE2]MDT7531697.1 3-isopropylmalate dehydratase small subunit [Sphingopyxis sp. SE2]
MSRAFRHLEGIGAALPLANIDTDKILPARFLSTISREGLADALFHTMRTDEAGGMKMDFVLNRQPWRDAVFLVALDNFGCGSSREHAPWALLDFGIRCLIAPSFADIFANNCTKNGMLTIELPRAQCEKLIETVSMPETALLAVDLPRQLLTSVDGHTYPFDVSPERRQRLMDGRDDIDSTLALSGAIEAHDARASYWRPSISSDIDLTDS